jgi:ribonuclease P protein subunit POP4
VKSLQKEKVDWSVLEKLHKLWLGYMLEVLGLDQKATYGKAKGKGTGPKDGMNLVVTAQNHGSRIASADFHGAMIEVVRSRCVDRVGIKGIVVRDGKFAFVIVEKNGGVKSTL